MPGEITDSHFHMWRAIFAMAHADGVVTAEETAFMREYLGNVPFSESQKAILEEDMRAPQNVADMFRNITEQADRSQFFYFARLLAWCDGDFDAQEKAILDRLKISHLSGIDMEEISRSVRESASLVARDIKEKGADHTTFRESLKSYKGGN